MGSRGVATKAVDKVILSHPATTRHRNLLSLAVAQTQFTKVGESTTTKTRSTSSLTEVTEFNVTE